METSRAGMGRSLGFGAEERLESGAKRPSKHQGSEAAPGGLTSLRPAVVLTGGGAAGTARLAAPLKLATQGVLLALGIKDSKRHLGRRPPSSRSSGMARASAKERVRGGVGGQ